MPKNNYQSASEILLKLEEETPPPKPPKSARDFVESNAQRINALIKRGWPVSEVTNRLSESGVRISERTLLSYLKKALEDPKRGRGRPPAVKGN